MRRRVLVISLVGLLVAIGLVLSVMPGPAFVFFGLAVIVLAGEFAWAQRWLRAWAVWLRRQGRRRFRGRFEGRAEWAASHIEHGVRRAAVRRRRRLRGKSNPSWFAGLGGRGKKARTLEPVGGGRNPRRCRPLS